ncbi:MAG: hypothetical protein JJ863_23465 [Deltaproteobacteria bacterium]|nr:hypothetical protein [Deltaproteobacteria bacterium]
MPAATRDELRKALLVARQRAEAADTLWANGHAAEALMLAAKSFEETLLAAEPLAGELPAKSEKAGKAEADEPKADEPKADAEEPNAEAEEPNADPEEPNADPEKPNADAEKPNADAEEPNTDAEEPNADAEKPKAPKTDADSVLGAAAAVFAKRGVPADLLTEAAEIAKKLRADLPTLDEDVSPTHAETFRAAMRVRRRLHDALSPAALTPKEVKLKKAGRWAGLLAGVVLVVGALFLMLRTPHEAVATASGYFANSPQYAPDKAIDDDENTEWLLADGQTGWLEVRLSPPRSIRQLRIRNGHNRHFRDRAVKEYEVELFDSSGASVGSTEGHFEQLNPDGEWAEHDLGGSDITRIRLTVKSFHRSGPALAEIDWVE